ncbi:LacI family DNA-binding transcriptional regulator [Leadbettera azotonutricia]|uniref:Transcriptional regulator, LacI family n=1 Tax=Leadbettera azotonutricia (strain ATCC BAA-888 / DSM 13862 / ZAS-9) TaxID=545695 RepID=F5YEA8_LEAAZ|nr:LacI family DNA-binding transcriptional regulator [Leadbettera azotonutricia]AEF80926.1 transcriptional regulator, LacI family [Leadbettera azotonutricia ZAS-9]
MNVNVREAPKRVTLKDIAQKTGFTINTVSRALKNKSDISEKTKKIIDKAAKAMGYVRDAAAGSMRSGQTNTLAVIVGDIANPFFGTLVRDIEFNAKQAGFSIIIYNTNENSRQEEEAIFSAYSKKVDGIIICPVQENTDNIKLLQKLPLPFVLVGRYFRDIEVDTVHWDDVKVGELAAGYLLDRGHTNILYAGGPLYISSGTDRLQGYRDAHKKRGIRVKEDLIKITDIKEGKTRDAIIQVLKDKIPFTAIMAHSDLMAYEIIYALRGRFPHIQVTGCDNLQEKLMIPLNFPTVGSKEDEAKLCIDILMDKIQNKIGGKPVVKVLDVVLKTPENSIL